MDAIRKKMQSLKSETDGLYKTIAGFEEATREAAARADQVSLLKMTLVFIDCQLKYFSTENFCHLQLETCVCHEEITISSIPGRLRHP